MMEQCRGSEVCAFHNLTGDRGFQQFCPLDQLSDLKPNLQRTTQADRIHTSEWVTMVSLWVLTQISKTSIQLPEEFV
jgi:hypothetical protein